MLLDIQGVLLIVTLISNTQTVDRLVHPVRNRAQINPLRNRVQINPVSNRAQINNKGPQKQKKWDFDDYLTKFEPRTIWERIDKLRKYHGEKISEEEQSEMMFSGIDAFDEIMDLKIENGDPKMVIRRDGRRGWTPRPGMHPYVEDHFQLRRRFYELMKQAIYQTRDKMTIMQIYREKYSNSSLYKMGFLMNKADNAAKNFGRFSFRAFRGCLLSRERVIYRMPVFDLLSSHERQLNHWFNVELLVDLINQNDNICKEIFKNYTLFRKKHFDEQFVV